MKIFNTRKAWTGSSFVLMTFSIALFIQCSDDKDEVKDPVASFELINEDPMWVGDVIDFANLSKDADEYLWDFGDGTTTAEEHPGHIYSVAGQYTVSLVATSDNGSDETTMVITILPYKEGSDITSQLRADLEAGNSVVLPGGTFYVSQSILIENYPGGTIRGANMDNTIIRTAENFQAVSNRFTGGSISGIVEFELTQGDVTVSDMTILVEGATPALGHNNPFTGMSTNMDNIFVVVGGGITVRYENLQIKGENVGDVSTAQNGYNLSWPLIASSGDSGLPINLDAVNCTIEGAGEVAIEYWIPGGGVANIQNCTVKNSYIGVWAGLSAGQSDSECEVTVKGIDLSNITTDAIKLSGISKYCVQNNTLDGIAMTDDCNLN